VNARPRPARRAAPAVRFTSELASAHRIADVEGEVLAVSRAFLALLRRHFGLTFASLILREEHGAGFLLVGGRLAQPIGLRRIGNEDAASLAALMRSRAARRLSHEQMPAELRAPRDDGFAIPLTSRAGTRALLVLRQKDAATLDDPEMRALVEHLAVALANAEAYRRARDLSFLDELSGVYNYRFLIEAIERETRRAQRFEHTFSVIMLDLDNLKGYNDRFGHLRGSEAIRTIGEILSATLRRVDLAARYGGDEFAVILPRTDKKGALRVCERLRQRIRSYPFPGAGGAGVITASFGISSFPQDGKSSRVLLRKADRALYRAKARGRDAVST
jgi:diguanylate cyclase (GGDEF)-like protein